MARNEPSKQTPTPNFYINLPWWKVVQESVYFYCSASQLCRPSQVQTPKQGSDRSHLSVNTYNKNIINESSVAARKLSSKFHAKVSRNFRHESLILFAETFPWKFRQNFTQNFAKISHNLHKIEYTEVKIA